MKHSLLVLLVLSLATATAQIGHFGHNVDDTSDRFANALRSGGPNAIRFIDEGGAGLTPDDTLFISQSSTVQQGDIALNARAGMTPGQQVGAASPLVGSGLATLSGQVAYYDSNGDGVFDSGDIALWDQNGIGQDTMSTHDIILSGSAAGSSPSGGTPGINGPVTRDSSALLLYLDLDESNTYTIGDGVYLDMSDDDHATTTDVRLTRHNNLAFAEVLTLDSPDTALLLRTTGAPQIFGFIDESGDGNLQSGEAVYLMPNIGTAPTSVRVTNSAYGDAGTQVRGSSSDRGAPRVVLNGHLASTGDGDDLIEEGEILVFDVTGTNVGRADGLDVVLSGEHAGRFAKDVPSINGAIVDNNVVHYAYLDTDGNGAWGLNDVAYYDADNNGFVSQFDVQLSGPPIWYTVPTPTQTPTPTPTETETPTPTSQSPTPTVTATDDETETDGNSVPMPVWVPLALLAALLVRRRL